MAIAVSVIPPFVELEVQLRLTHDEAQAVFDVLRRVGGSPDHSRRKHIESVLIALAPIGLRSTMQRGVDDLEDNIYFRDTR